MDKARYEVLFQSALEPAVTALHTTTDPNEATVAYHAELSRLLAGELWGELLLRKQNDDRQVVLRQPVRAFTSRD
jgi:hypothetical protein